MVIVYARVSTQEQAKHGYSLAAQVEACRKRALELGASAGEVLDFVDEGISGGVLERPALSRARELLRSGGVDYFICYHPDRLARDLVDQMVITKEVDRAGTRLEFVDFDWRNTPEGLLWYQIRGSFAQYEKALIRERTMRGKRKKAQSGGIPTYAKCYGYRQKDGVLEIVPEEAAVVRRVFDLAAGGATPHSIARMLNDEGVPPPAPPDDGRRKKGKEPVWMIGAVLDMLRRETYAGTLWVFRQDARDCNSNRYRPEGEKAKRKPKAREDWIAVPVPSILDRQTWEAVQLRLADPRRRSMGHPKYFYLLRDMCVCGLCGRPVHGTGRERAGKPLLRWYTCSGRHLGSREGGAVLPEERCKLPYMPADVVEMAVWAKVKAWLADPGLLVEEMGRQHETPKRKALEEREEIQRLLAAMKIEEERIYHAYHRGYYGEDKLADFLAKLNERRTRLTARQADLEAELAVSRVSPTQMAALEAIRESLGGDLDSLEQEEQRRILSLLVRRVTIRHDSLTVHAQVAVAGEDPGRVVEGLSSRKEK